MNVLVTGATGLIGKAIVIKLIASGNRVIEFGSQRTSDQASRFETDTFYSVDVSDANAVNAVSIADSIDVVIHSAGLAHQFGDVADEEFFRINVKGTANICALAKSVGAKQLILISSVSVYGSSKKTNVLIDENTKCDPQGAYAQSKLESENVARAFCENNSISLMILRPATVIGEGDPGNVRKLIRAVVKRRFIWIGKGENLKSLIYKDDVARACEAVLGYAGSDIFNVSAEPIKMVELVNLIENATGRSVIPLVIPIGFALFISKVARKIGFKRQSMRLNKILEKWTSDDAYCSAKLRKHFNYQPQTSVETGINREVEWYLKHSD